MIVLIQPRIISRIQSGFQCILLLLRLLLHVKLGIGTTLTLTRHWNHADALSYSRSLCADEPGFAQICYQSAKVFLK